MIEDRVGDAAFDPVAQPVGVGHEQVVADELDAVAELARQAPPGVPVVLGAPILDRHHRIAVDDLRPEARHRRAGLGAALEAVDAVGEHFTRRRVEGDRDPLPVTGALGGLEDRLDRRLARVEVGREAALVADGGREPPLVQQAFSA